MLDHFVLCRVVQCNFGVILANFFLCTWVFSVLFGWYSSILVAFVWYLCFIWVVFVYGWYAFDWSGQKIVHPFYGARLNTYVLFKYGHNSEVPILIHMLSVIIYISNNTQRGKLYLTKISQVITVERNLVKFGSKNSDHL